MKDQDPTDDRFLAKYEAHQRQASEDFLKEYASTELELREMIDYLIHHRQLLRDAEINELEGELQRYMEMLKKTKTKILLEEISCLRDILALHKQRCQENDKPRD